MSVGAELLRDPGGQLSAQQALQQPRQASDPAGPEGPEGAATPGWRPLAALRLSLGHTRDVIWLRLTLPAHGGANPEHWLVAGQPFLDELTLFVPPAEAGQPAAVLNAGDHVPLAQRPAALPEAVFPVLLRAEPMQVLLRVRSTSALTLNVVLWSPQAYAVRNSHEQALHGLLQGLMLTSAVVSLLPGVWLRRRFFFVAAAYVLATGALHAVLAGYDQLFVYPGRPWLADHLVGVLSFGVAALSVVFSLSYLQPRAWFPRFTRGMEILAGVLAAGAAVSVLGGYPHVAPWLSRLALLTVLGLSVLFVLMLRHPGAPRQRALVLLVMFLPSLLAAALQALRNVGVLPASFWTTQLWGLTAFLQMPYATVVVLLQVREEQRRATLAERREREQRDFLDMMAHELRTPLSVLGTALANIELRSDARQPELQPRFRRATAALARLNTLVDNALADHRLRDSPLQPHWQPVRPSELAARLRQRLAIEPPHQWREQLPADDGPLLLDAAWLDMALVNLVDNALKYAPEGGELLLHIERDAQRLRLSLQDQGPGIAAEHHARLFERFERGPLLAGRGAVPGVGLGLYLVAEVARRHGGRVLLESAPGRGSRFTLELPLRPAPGDAAEQPAGIAAGPQPAA
jgi:two-component system, sensor histidine kinase LadS